MFTELLITTFAIIGLVVLRLGVPILLMWLFGKVLRYAHSVLP